MNATSPQWVEKPVLVGKEVGLGSVEVRRNRQFKDQLTRLNIKQTRRKHLGLIGKSAPKRGSVGGSPPPSCFQPDG